MRKHLFLAVLLVVFLAVAAGAGAEEPVCTTGILADRAVVLVENAEHFIAGHTREEAIQAFHDPQGAFRDGELYILFYGFDGTCLANGFKPELAGLNRYDVQDPTGVYQVREMIELSKGGGGWVQYQYENPDTGRIEPKATYVKRAPGMDAFVGCGIYAGK